MAHDQFDVPLHDPDLLAEIELTSRLIIACSCCSSRLEAAAIDQLLGVRGTRA